MPFKSQEGHNGAVLWKNADVALPILSTQELARNGRRLDYGEHGGSITIPMEDKDMNFIAAHGVYWLKMLIPKHYVKPDADAKISVPPQGDPQPSSAKGGQGFGRPGKA